LLALPNAIAMIGLGYSLWREKRGLIPESATNLRASEPTAARV
jgi:hypothetical protein